MKYQNIFTYAQKKNFTYLAINTKKNTSLDIEVHNDKLKKYETSKVTSYLLNGNINNKVISLETESLKNYSNLIDEMLLNANLLEEENAEINVIKENIVNNEKLKLSSQIEAKLSDLLSIHNYLKEYPDLTDIDANYGESITETDVYTSDNKHLRDINKIYYFTSEIFAHRNNINSSSFVIKESTKDNLDFHKLVLSSIEDTINKLECQNIPSGKYKVLLTNEVSANILESFISLFSALSIQKKISLLSDKLNKQVFSSELNIIEDPSNKEFIGKRLFDDEGTKTFTKEIIQDGYFRQILYDNQTALKDKKTSTGNNYGKITTRNLYIKPGNDSYQELIKKMDTGIIINSVQGMHAGINLTTGDISLQSEGYYVLNGVIKYPIKLFVLVTDIFKLYQNIIAIGNDLDFYSSTCGSPSLLVDDIQISK